MVALRSALQIAARHNDSTNVFLVVEPRTEAAPGGIAEIGRRLKDVLDAVVPPPLQSSIVLLQIHDRDHHAGAEGALELVRRLKLASPCWAVLSIGRECIYGAEGRETWCWPLPHREFSDPDWACFLAEAAEFYVHSQDLGQAVSQALDSMR